MGGHILGELHVLWYLYCQNQKRAFTILYYWTVKKPLNFAVPFLWILPGHSYTPTTHYMRKSMMWELLFSLQMVSNQIQNARRKPVN